jgi:hypothetical protein
MNFSKITIHSETEGTIILTPEHLYQMSDHDVKYVVMYNLKFINSGQIIEANIPYYISNGATNKLRANMLYPFMCYSSINEASTCPYDISRRTRGNPYISILLKYNSPGNINIDKLEEDLLQTFFSIYSDLEEEKSKMSSKIRNKHEQDNDLISVLQRITNFLDFIICILNDVIRDFNYLSQKIDIDNGKYRPLSREQKARHDYTDLSIFGEETIYNITQHKTDDSSSPYNNHFRLVILTILNKYYKLFVDNSLINIEQVVLQPEILTVEMFNRVVNICDKETAKLNMKNYKIISNKIIHVIIEKIDRTEPIPEQDKIILKSLIIRTTKSEVPDDKIYDHLLKNWNAHCLSKAVTLENGNIYTMNFEEICDEISRYSHILENMGPINEQINQICKHKTLQNPLSLKFLREQLIMIRTIIIQYNYIGQFIIRYKTSDGTEKIIKVDVDSSETILTLKSKIFNMEGIEPSRQELSYTAPFGENIIHLENKRTIASYKIPNYSILKLIIR